MSIIATESVSAPFEIGQWIKLERNKDINVEGGDFDFSKFSLVTNLGTDTGMDDENVIVVISNENFDHNNLLYVYKPDLVFSRILTFVSPMDALSQNYKLNRSGMNFIEKRIGQNSAFEKSISACSCHPDRNGYFSGYILVKGQKQMFSLHNEMIDW